MKVKVKHIETRSLTRLTQYILCYFIHIAFALLNKVVSSIAARQTFRMTNQRQITYVSCIPSTEKIRKPFRSKKSPDKRRRPFITVLEIRANRNSNDVVVREKLPGWGDKLTMKVQHFSMLSSPTQSPSLLVKLERRQLSQQRTDCAVHHLNRDEFQVSSVVG